MARPAAVAALRVLVGDRGAVWLADDVEELVAREVPAFDECGDAVASGEFEGALLHVLLGGELAPEEDLGFVEVGGDDGGEREELVHEGFDGVGLEEALAAGGDEDGIDDELDRWPLGEEGGDALDGFAAEEHAGLSGLDLEEFDDMGGLIDDEIDGDGVDVGDAFGVLGGEAGEGGGAVDAVGGEGEQIDLGAGVGSGVRACDGHCDGSGEARDALRAYHGGSVGGTLGFLGQRSLVCKAAVIGFRAGDGIWNFSW